MKYYILYKYIVFVYFIQISSKYINYAIQLNQIDFL